MTPVRTPGTRSRAHRAPTGCSLLVASAVGVLLLATVFAGPALAGQPATDGRTADAQAVQASTAGPDEEATSIAVKTRQDGTDPSLSRKVAAIAPERADTSSTAVEWPRPEYVELVRTETGVAATDPGVHLATGDTGSAAAIEPRHLGASDGALSPAGEGRTATPGGAASGHHSSTFGVAQPQTDLSDPVADMSVPAGADPTAEGADSALLFGSILLNAVLGLLVVARRLGPETLSRPSGSLWTAVRTGSTADGDGSGTDDVPDTPVTDTEIVRHLLDRHGGRMPQSDIVESTEWSKAKVSRLLTEMDDAGDIVKVQLGRQNLICLAGSEPELSKPMT